MTTSPTTSELERRRKRAVQAVRQGQSPATVAKVLGVHPGTVYRWLRMDQKPGGLDPIPLHRPLALSPEQLRPLERLLLQGASKHGWPNDLWTAARVAQLIKRHFAVSLHPEYVRKLLKKHLGWTSRRPQTRAKERDEEEIERRKRLEFPRIAREAQEREAHLVFLDESCFRLTPTVRRTLAPRGQTPILPCWDSRDKISAISAITLSPRRQLPGLEFVLLPDRKNFRAEQVVDFLRLLRQRYRRFTVVWDRSPIHSRSKEVRGWLAGHPEVVVEDLPGYAPELNPDELVWCWVKYGRLCNYAAPGLAELRARVEAEIADLAAYPYMLLDFLDHTELSLAA